MAYKLGSGQTIGGNIGEALAAANPSKGVSQAFTSTIEKATGRTISGGGGGGSSSSNAAKKAQEAAAKKAAAKKAQEAAAKKAAAQKAAAQKAAAQKAAAQKAAITLENKKSIIKSILQSGSIRQSRQAAAIKQITDIFKQQSSYSQPYYQKIQVGSIRDKSTGQIIPVTSYFLIDPNTGSAKKATSKEQNELRKYDLTVEKAQGPKGIIAKQEVEREILRTKKQRGEKLTTKEELTLMGRTALQSVASSIIGVRDIPKSIITLAKNPKSLLQIPSSISRSGKQFGKLLVISPSEAFVQIGTEILLTKGTGKTLKLIGRYGKTGAAKILPFMKGINKTKLGVNVIKGVKKVGDIEIIPESGAKIGLNVRKSLKGIDVSEQLKKIPKIPKLTNTQEKILNLLKKDGGVVSGSLSRKILLKKSRKFKDLDLAVKDRVQFIKDLKKIFGNKIKFVNRKVSIEAQINGKPVADIVKYSEGEEGLIKKYGYIEVDGIRVANPKAVLGGKLTALSKSRVGKIKEKTLKDIESLSKGKLEVIKPSITGAFSKSKKELKSAVKKTGPVASSQIDIFNKLKKNLKEGKLEKWLYASPFDPNTGKAQLRISRLGLGNKDMKLTEYLLGEEIKINKPQILIFPEEKIFSKGAKKLTKEQIKKTKGFTVPEFSSELEVVLGSNHIIKKGKRLTTVIIKGESVPVYEVKKIKITKEIKDLANKLKNQKNILNKKIKINSKNSKIIEKSTENELRKIKSLENKLNNKLKSKTGFNYKLSSEIKKNGKKIPLTRTTLASVIRKSYTTQRKPTGRTPRKPTTRKPTTRKPTTRKPTTRKPTGRTPRKPTPRKQTGRTPRKPTGRTQRKPIGRTPRKPTPRKPRPGQPRKEIEKKTLKTKRRKIQVKTKRRKKYYNVIAKPIKKGSKQVKVNDIPLQRGLAQDLRNYITDTSLSRDARLVRVTPKKGQVVNPDKSRINVPKGYAKKTSNKFRTYRIVKGKKVPLRYGRVIERTRAALDTRQEKNRIALAKRIKQIQKPKAPKGLNKRKSTYKRGSVAAKKAMEKARAAKKKNARKK